MTKRSIAESVIVITGASSGIGRATALELASRGATVVLASRSREALDDVAEECEEAGGHALAVPTDTTREQEVQELARRTIANFGRIDVWINDAAVASFGRFDTTPADVYRRVLETNFIGYVNGARAAIQQFRKQSHGVLINVGSVTSGAPQPYTSAYVASKFAVRGWSACLRMELSLEKLRDIHVCHVMPAAIDTPLFQHAANFTGRAIRALDPTYQASKVARVIASVIERPRAEVVAGRAGTAVLAQASLSPRVYEKLFARYIDENHFQDKTAPPTDGNLFEPRGPKSVSGGWSGAVSASEPQGRWGLAVAGAALGAFAAALALRKAKREP